jgi:hypothetical protein
MMSLYYEDSDGTIIDFMSNGIYAQEPETLTANSWNYTTISGVNDLGKVKQFYKDTQETSLTLDIMASNEKEFNEMMYKMHKSFDRDIRRLQPGKLWWNGFYKEVFVVEVSHSGFDELFESVEKTIKLISVYPYWIRKNTYHYMKQVEIEGKLDYGLDGFFDGFDYDEGSLDYDTSEEIGSLVNDCIESANFEIIFYGPAEIPSVRIGGHEYELYITLEQGEYAKINSITKKIYKYNSVGVETNIFSMRNKDSYIFEKINEGENAISKDKDLSVDISIFDERGEPEWI